MLQVFLRHRPENSFRITSAPQMCEPGLLESVSSPEFGKALPGRETVFTGFRVTILDNKTENKVSTSNWALLALRSVLPVTHPDVREGKRDDHCPASRSYQKSGCRFLPYRTTSSNRTNVTGCWTAASEERWHTCSRWESTFARFAGTKNRLAGCGSCWRRIAGKINWKSYSGILNWPGKTESAVPVARPMFRNLWSTGWRLEASAILCPSLLRRQTRTGIRRGLAGTGRYRYPRRPPDWRTCHPSWQCETRAQWESAIFKNYTRRIDRGTATRKSDKRARSCGGERSSIRRLTGNV